MKSPYFLLLLIGTVNAQNWAVFNPGFRYNYRFDNEPSITQVIFAEQITYSGSDTVCRLNRVVRPCPGGCPGSTVVPGGQQLYIADQPQFLQGTLTKKANGSTELSDTLQINFPAGISPGLTWQFNTTQNFSATCVSQGTQSIFGQADSIKTMLLNGTDTIKLSKRFGLYVYPLQHPQYYRLAGIEAVGSYDPQALYGEKVANAWDFYNYQVGDVLCYEAESRKPLNGQLKIPRECTYEQWSITSKAVTSSGYQYSAHTYEVYDLAESSQGSAFPNCTTGNYYTKTLTFNNLSSSSLPENRMYPGMFVDHASWVLPVNTFSINVFVGEANIARLIHFNNQQHKFLSLNNTYAGIASSMNDLMKVSGSVYVMVSLRSGYDISTDRGVEFAYVNHGEYYSKHSLACFKRNGVNVFGVPRVGLSEQTMGSQYIFPNPCDEFFQIQGQLYGEIEVTDLLGRAQWIGTASPGLHIPVNNWPAGVYFLTSRSTPQISLRFVVLH